MNTYVFISLTVGNQKYGFESKRSCTDVVFLLAFIAFLVGWFFVGSYAMTNGNLHKMEFMSVITNNEYIKDKVNHIKNFTEKIIETNNLKGRLQDSEVS